MEVHAWCIIPSHVHLIIGTTGNPMQDILGDFKSYTSRCLKQEILDHPIELSTNEMMDQRLNYLHQNPVVAGFVAEAEHWRWSSAIDYCGGKGLIDVILIE